MTYTPGYLLRDDARRKRELARAVNGLYGALATLRSELATAASDYPEAAAMIRETLEDLDRLIGHLPSQ